ncbi:MAG TPA: CapA family protein [Candidatus Dormibacteraeota bacterium]|nr:CapA family protein [Candidatus Dormibacteraeota bacterium]
MSRSRPASLLVVALVLGGCVTPNPTPKPTDVGPTPSSFASSQPTSTPAPSRTAAANPSTFPLAVVTGLTNLEATTTLVDVRTLVAAGKLLIPCGLSGLDLGGKTVALPSACTATTDIFAAIHKTPTAMALLPAGLVDPRVKVLPVDGADLFGDTVVRTKPYPVIGSSDGGASALPASATAYDAGAITSIVSTGDTCPDRAPSYWANVKGKGWDWTLQGGTARYTGTYIDHQFSPVGGNGYTVVKAVRTGEDIGAIWNLIKDADIAVNDFECPMVANFTQHNSGTFFTIDPKVAALFHRVGMDFASLGSNHGTDLGASGIQQTLAYLDAAGVKYSGAGLNLAQAMAPAVFDVHGVRFAFLSWDATGVSRAATDTGWGELHPTPDNVTRAVALARSQADVVILMPQWNFPEYSAPFSRTALAQRDAWFAAGVDDILGSGTHWSSAISITQPDPSKGWRVAVTSHGNFLFGQLFSRQTQEGLIYEVTFRGTQLVQVRMHPYIVMDGAQPNLTDPATDGAHVQNQVLDVSTLP